MRATSNYHSKRKDISENQNEVCKNERDVYQNQKENSRRKIKSILLILKIKNINVYKKRYNEEVWLKNKMSQSRIKKVMKKILLRNQINNFFLKRVFVITICVIRLSNSTFNSFKTLKKNEIFVVKRFLSKSIMTLLIFQLLTLKIFVVIQHFYWNLQSLARLRNAKKSLIKKMKQISETLLNWSFRQILWKKINH